MKINKNDILEKIDKLRKTTTVYSFSRLGAYDICPYQYYLTYIKKDRGLDGIYGILGSTVHEILEKEALGETVDREKVLKDKINECISKDILFPTQKSGENWVEDIVAFLRDFKLDDAKHNPEIPFCLELKSKVNKFYIQGFIDDAIENNDGTISIIDYKTSTLYKSKDREEKGRQLVIYAMALEELGYKIKNVAWNFLKYVNVEYHGKDNIYKTIAKRGKLATDLNRLIKKALKENGYEKMTNGILSVCEWKQDISSLPENVREKFKITPCIVYYRYTEETKKECVDWLINRMTLLSNIPKSEICYPTKKGSYYSDFFCKNLCSHRENCKHKYEKNFI